jgi:hypothetical protein
MTSEKDWWNIGGIKSPGDSRNPDRDTESRSKTIGAKESPQKKNQTPQLLQQVLQEEEKQ